MSMKVLVAADAQLYRTPDNKVWCRTIYQYNIMGRLARPCFEYFKRAS